jgi:hypothetical protein
MSELIDRINTEATEAELSHNRMKWGVFSLNRTWKPFIYI